MQIRPEISENSSNSTNSPVSPGPTISSNVSNDDSSRAIGSSSDQYNDSSTSSQTTDGHDVNSSATNVSFGTFDDFIYSIETNNQSSVEENAGLKGLNDNMDKNFFDKGKTKLDQSKTFFDHDNNFPTFYNSKISETEDFNDSFEPNQQKDHLLSSVEENAIPKNLGANINKNLSDKDENLSSLGDSKVPEHNDSESSDDLSNNESKNKNKTLDDLKKTKEDILKIISKRENSYNNPNDNIRSGQNLLDYIPGLYLLLDLKKDEGSNGLVNKIIISKESLEKFCNDLAPSSFKSASDIKYTELNRVSFHLVGCYGNYELIAKLLLIKKTINRKMYKLLVSSNKTGSPSLHSGIYLLIVNVNLGLVIHWPEPGCYEDNATDQLKKNMVSHKID
ncbi:13889_t:CDS:2 [Entrophospora sp. SA101]|nr:13895_t:CDS:2 [Entrophospora sp. SA101]CAJ0762988.1 13889_t:CDS:2 [Entrophospora sp. SA101]